MHAVPIYCKSKNNYIQQFKIRFRTRFRNNEHRNIRKSNNREQDVTEKLHQQITRELRQIHK